MAKTQLTCIDDPDKPAPNHIEVEVFFVPGTDNLFAVHDSFEGEDLFVLTHVRSGLCVARSDEREDVVWVAHQMYAAAPEAWRLIDLDAVRNALPPPVERWGMLIRKACAQGIPLVLLKSCADYCREMETPPS